MSYARQCIRVSARVKRRCVQLEGSKRDTARVVNENNQLHVQLIREAERFDAQQASHYQRVKELEGEIAELSFWKHQASGRLQNAERESLGLKERLQELLKIGATTLHCDWHAAMHVGCHHMLYTSMQPGCPSADPQ